MMAGRRDIGSSKTVVIVADEPEVRGAIRTSLGGDGHYVLECRIGDLRNLIRSIKVDAISVVGERTSLLVAQLREAIAGVQISARHISLVSSATDAQDALRRACSTD
jgi:hypothetical protein